MAGKFPKISLILGGASSGKSAFAEQLVLKSGRKPVYIATCTADDAEMQARIQRHRERRDGRWRELEVPLELANALGWIAADEIVLVDCMTLWLSNLMEAQRDVDEALALFLRQMHVCAQPVVLVSNELGMGLVPETSLGRRFRDQQGKINQSLAKAADTVTFVAAGLPLSLKGKLP
ncbi:MAG: bifunctional adenosylcobinamide kinase/adenosylcobinamide-phosphate guanylyltransferase [Paracoccaceae bacterium]